MDIGNLPDEVELPLRPSSCPLAGGLRRYCSVHPLAFVHDPPTSPFAPRSGRACSGATRTAAWSPSCWTGCDVTRRPWDDGSSKDRPRRPSGPPLYAAVVLRTTGLTRLGCSSGTAADADAYAIASRSLARAVHRSFSWSCPGPHYTSLIPLRLARVLSVLPSRAHRLVPALRPVGTSRRSTSGSGSPTGRSSLPIAGLRRCIFIIFSVSRFSLSSSLINRLLFFLDICLGSPLLPLTRLAASRPISTPSVYECVRRLPTSPYRRPAFSELRLGSLLFGTIVGPVSGSGGGEGGSPLCCWPVISSFRWYLWSPTPTREERRTVTKPRLSAGWKTGVSLR